MAHMPGPAPSSDRVPESQKPVRPRLSRASSQAINRFQGWTNGRTREGRFLRRYSELLLQHLGHEPSPVELSLVRRSARLALRLELLDTQMLAGQGPGDLREYPALNAQFIRCMKALGLHKHTKSAAPPKLAGYLATKARSGQGT